MNASIFGERSTRARPASKTSLAAVAGTQADRICPGPVLEMDAAIGEDFLNRVHELVNEGVQLLEQGPMLPQADVEWIAETDIWYRAFDRRDCFALLAMTPQSSVIARSGATKQSRREVR
jgi:hypothetical protein